MGIIEKLFGKKQEKKETVETLSIEDASSLLSKKFAEEFQSRKESFDMVYGEMQSVASEIRRDLIELEKANFTDKVDFQLLQNTIAHKKSFINKMRIMLVQVNKPAGSDFDSILDFHRATSSAIFEADEKTVNDYYFLKELFEKEAENTIREFKALSKLSKNLDGLIESGKERLIPIRDAQQEISSIKEELINFGQKEGQLSSLQTNLMELKENHDKAEKDLNSIVTGKEWIEFNKMLDEKKNIESEIESLKLEIFQKFSSINRPLKKFNNLVQRDIEKIGNGKLLALYIDSQYDAILADKNCEFINSILKKIQASISDNKIDIRDKEKVLSEIKWMLENNFLADISNRIHFATEKLENLKSAIENQKVLDSKNKVENELKGINEKIKMMGVEVQRVGSQIEKINQSIQDKKDNLEKLLALADRKIIVKVK